VLVLGAGASKPYGYPMGKELYYQALAHLAQDQSNHATFLRTNGFGDDFVPFRDALRNCGGESIDTFLEGRREFVPIGKAVIAYTLCHHEDHGVLFDEDRAGRRWYKHLFKIMKADVPRLEEFSGNELAVVTFNYDRSLEHFFITSLKHTFGKSDDECADELSKVPIIHVHGRLGWLPWQDNGPGRVYGMPVSAAGMVEAAESIKIVHEQSDVDTIDEFVEAHKLLAEASIICFLGFGYDKKNVERLRLGRLNGDYLLKGTCFGHTEHERGITANLLKQMLPRLMQHRVTIGQKHQDILAYLRSNPVLS